MTANTTSGISICSPSNCCNTRPWRARYPVIVLLEDWYLFDPRLEEGKRHSEATLLIVRLRQMMLAESSGIVLHIWSKI